MSSLIRGAPRPLQRRLFPQPTSPFTGLASRQPRFSKLSSTMAPQPSWLTSLLAQPLEPPKLYAWTPANLGLKDPPRPSRADTDPSHRIYILGVGNMGRLYATYLSKHDPPPPITLVVHRPSLLETWSSSPGITFTHHGATETVADLDVEYWTPDRPGQGPVREVCDGGVIPNIIVSTKTNAALPEVDRLRRYLDGSSTVALAQNGVNKLWPPHGPAYASARFPRGGDGANRDNGAPNFVHCITTHGVVSLAPFTSRHASLADSKVGLVLPNPGTRGSAEWFLDTVASAPLLDSSRVDRADLWVLQLEKLVVNAVINPMTAVLRCRNGVLFEDANGVLPRVMDRLLQETSQVYLALVSHSSSNEIISEAASDLLAAKDQLRSRFTVESLRDMLWGVGRKVTENTSSMLQDVQAGKATEVRDFNGWIIDTAHFLESSSLSTSTPSSSSSMAPSETGSLLLDVRCHAKLMDLVEGGVIMTAEQLGEALLGEL